MSNLISTVLRSAFRPFRRSPLMSLVGAVVLGLGMGAAVSVYSAVDAILVEDLPFRDADRLVEIRSVRGGDLALFSMRDLDDVRTASADLFDDIAAYIPGSQYSLAGNAEPEKAPAILLTRNLFSVLGVSPAQGTVWPESYDEERSFGLVLGHDLWQRQFGGDPGIIGGTVALDASPFYSPAYDVFGVMPEGFNFPAKTDLYRSIFINSTYPGLEARDSRVVVGVARLTDGVSLAQAQERLNGVARDLSAGFPETNESVAFVLRPLRDAWVSDTRAYLLVLMGAAGLLLLAACANLANMALSRALARESELAVMTALGAGRTRLLANLAGEGMSVSAVGGGFALAFAAFAIRFIRPDRFGLPPWMEPSIDGSVVLFTVVMAATVGVAVGLWPARAGLARDVMGVLRRDSRGGAGSLRQRRLREALVSVEVGLSLALLLGSALMARTFIELSQVNPGLESRGLLTLQVPLPWSYPRAERVAFQEEVIRRVRDIPGVVDAATNANPPFTSVGQPDRVVLDVEGAAASDRADHPYMNIQRVSPTYFATTGIPILEGRPFDGIIDRDSTRLAAIVSERLAGRLWPAENPIGKRLKRNGDENPWWEVVGVAGDVRYDGLSGAGGFDVYLSSLQAVDGWAYLLVRTAGDPLAVESATKAAIWSVDARQPVVDVRTMEARVADTVGPQRLAATLFAVFAATALALAASGVFAVVSLLVRQRTPELGIRIALGADSGRIFRGVLLDTLTPTAIGVLIGVVGGVGIALGVRGFLYGVSPWDPVSFGIATGGLVLVSLLAAAIPAWRAARIDPTQAFREGG